MEQVCVQPRTHVTIYVTITTQGGQEITHTFENLHRIPKNVHLDIVFISDYEGPWEVRLTKMVEWTNRENKNPGAAL